MLLVNATSARGYPYKNLSRSVWLVFQWKIFTDECIHTFWNRLFYKDNFSACDRSCQEKQLEGAQALMKNDSSDLFNEIRMTLLISLPELINHGWLSLYFMLYQYHSLTLMCTKTNINCKSLRTVENGRWRVILVNSNWFCTCIKKVRQFIVLILKWL